MEPTSQLIRFSIPGSIFVLAGVGTYAFAQVLWGESLGDVESLTTLTTSITAIAASIPLGFLIYQIYYWRYSPFVIGDIVTRDRGRDALWGLPPDVLGRLRTLFDARLDVRRHHRSVTTLFIRKLKLLRLNDDLLRARYKDKRLVESAEDEALFEKDNRSVRRIYSDNWYENWDVFRALLDLVATQGNRPEIKRNFTTLYDIYHSLGASRLAVVLGSAAGVLYLCGAHRDDISAHLTVSGVGLVVVTISALLLAYILHRTRIATWRSAISKVRLDLLSCLAPGSDLLEALPQAEGFKPRSEMRHPANQLSRPYRRPILSRLGDKVVSMLLNEIGSIEWSRRTKGILGRRERARFFTAVLTTTVLEAPRTLTGRVRRRGLGLDPSEVTLPDTAFANDVIEACSDLEPMVLEHGYRSYIYADTLGEVEGLEYDQEALFAATMLHAHALPTGDALNGECFTWAGAEVVAEVLRDSPLADRVRRDVLDAVTLHVNPVVGPTQGALQHLTHDGVLLDLVGVRAWELDREGVERVIEFHPRHGLTTRGGTILRAHGRHTRGCRAGVLFHAGFGPALRLSHWRALDRRGA